MAEKNYDELVEEALQNANTDREYAQEAYEKMKSIFDIDIKNPETMQAIMLTGQSAVKLLESMSRSNEQIVKLAQLKQKDNKKSSSDDEERVRINIDDIRAASKAANEK